MAPPLQLLLPEAHVASSLRQLHLGLQPSAVYVCISSILASTFVAYPLHAQLHALAPKGLPAEINPVYIAWPHGLFHETNLDDPSLIHSAYLKKHHVDNARNLQLSRDISTPPTLDHSCSDL